MISRQKRAKKLYYYLVIEYDLVVFRSSNFGSIAMRTDSVLSAVWQLAAFKMIYLNNVPVNRYKSINISKVTNFGKTIF